MQVALLLSQVFRSIISSQENTFQSISIDVTKVGHGISKARVWLSVSSQMRCTKNQAA